MKKILLFLLLIPALLSAQRVDYYPKRDSTYKVIRDVGFNVVLPDNYGTSKKWSMEMVIHGVGEWSGGTKIELMNLIYGYDYNNDGFREGPPFVTDDMKRAVNMYGIVLVVPTYEVNTFFEPALINSIYDFVQAKYSLVPKMFLTGFSYGGGAVAKYITSSIANASRVAYAVPCAATKHLGADVSAPGKVGLPVHAFSNDKDDRVNVSNTVGIIDEINKSNPALKAIMTIFRRDGHGGNVEAWSLTPPKAPAGSGFTDAAENIYQVYLDILANGPRQMKSGTVITPVPTPVPTPITAKAIVSFTMVGNIVKLDGSKSTGYTTGLDGVWELASAPAGLYGWDVFLRGSSYIVADATLTKSGSYSFRFKLKGDPEVKTITVDYGKVPVGIEATGRLTFSDGSVQNVTVIFSNGQWVVKTDTGTIIQP